MASGEHGTGTDLSLDIAQQRIHLLSEAVEQSARLSAVLARIGHSRFVPIQNTADGDQLSTSSTSLEHAISTITSLEDALRRSYPALGEKQNEVLSPVSRLNDDLLRYIFLFPSRANELGQHQRRFAINVSRVCRRWRTLALDTGSMWAVVNVVIGQRNSPAVIFSRQPGFGTPRSRSIDGMMLKDKIFLQRSKGAKLTVHVNANGSLRQPFVQLPMQNAQAMQASLVIPSDYLAFSSRIQNLELMITEFAAYPPDLLLQFVGRCKNVLRRLTVSFARRDQPSETITEAMKTFLTTKFPNLVSLILNSLPVPATQRPYDALSSLRALELRAEGAVQFSADRLYTILVSCPNLRVFRVYTPFEQFEDPPVLAETNGRIRLVHLHTFSLQAQAWTDSVTAVFCAPALKSLSLSIGRGIVPEEQPSFTHCILSFLRSAPPPLRALDLVGVPTDCAAAIFLELPSVSHLVLADIPSASLNVGPLVLPNPTMTPSTSITTSVLNLLNANPASDDEEKQRQPHPLLPLLDVLQVPYIPNIRVLRDILDVVRSRKCRKIGSGWFDDNPSTSSRSPIKTIRHVQLGGAYNGAPPFGPGGDDSMDILQDLAHEVDKLEYGDFRFDVEEKLWKRWRPLPEYSSFGLDSLWGCC